MSIIVLNPILDNDQIARTKINKNKKIVGQFYGLQEQEIRDMRDEGLLTTAGYVHLVLRFLNPYFDKTLHINVPKFLKKWKLAKSSFHKAIAKLESLKIFTLGLETEIIYTNNPHQETVPEIDQNLASETSVSDQKIVSQIGDTIITSQVRNTSPRSETSVSDQKIVSQIDSSLSQIRDNEIYIDRACEKPLKKLQTTTDLTNHPPNPPKGIDGDGGSVGKESNKLNYYQDSEGEDSDRISLEPNTPTTPLDNNSIPSTDHLASACSTVENKASHNQENKVTTVHDRSEEYERIEREQRSQPKNYLAQDVRNWDRLNADQQATLEQITINGINRLEQPWRENGGQYTKKVREGVLKLKSWFDPAKIPAHLSKQERIIKNYRENPCEAIEAYQTLLSYCNPETAKPEPTDQRHPCGFRIVTDEEVAIAQKLLEEKFANF